jgi:hypothetical protein
MGEKGWRRGSSLSDHEEVCHPLCRKEDLWLSLTLPVTLLLAISEIDHNETVKIKISTFI